MNVSLIRRRRKSRRAETVRRVTIEEFFFFSFFFVSATIIPGSALFHSMVVTLVRLRSAVRMRFVYPVTSMNTDIIFSRACVSRNRAINP